MLKHLEQSTTASSKFELESLIKENSALRENERQLLKLKNSLEIEIQNLKVENERLSFNQSEKKEKDHKKKSLSLVEEIKNNDDSVGQVKPIKEFDSYKQANITQQKGMDKLSELDELIRSFKYRRLNTNKE